MRPSRILLSLVRPTIFCLILTSAASVALGQFATTFTYQGRLQDGGTNANGSYDFQFKLWDALSGGTQQPQPSPFTVTRSGVAVLNGTFTVPLDFGLSAFPGENRFLEISVKPTSAGTYSTLSPRQAITATPYAVRSLLATNADFAVTANQAAGATNATQLGGIAANQYVLTGDARLTDARPPTAGSSNYIQNTTIQQAANFNISGTGLIGSNVGIGTMAPSSVLHVVGSQPPAVSGDGTNAAPVLQIIGGKGGNSTSQIAYIGGTGGSVLIQGGDGGNGPNGGGGGSITFQPGQKGSGTVGNSGALFLAPSGGNVGIGTNPALQPVAKLHVLGDTVLAGELKVTQTNGRVILDRVSGVASNSAEVKFYTAGLQDFSLGTSQGSASPSDFSIYNYGTASNILTILKSSGNVGINSTTPTFKLHVNGETRTNILSIDNFVSNSGGPSLCASTSTNRVGLCSSSLRYKTNIHTFRSGLDIVNRLRPISFNWKEGGMRDIGLGAEEVDKIEPLLAFRNDKGEVEGVKYNQLSAVFINAFKEQQAQINQQQDQLKQHLLLIEQQAVLINNLRRLVCRRNTRATVCRR